MPKIIPDDEKRVERIPVLCTKEQKEIIKQKAKKLGLTASDYLRMKGLQD